MEHSTTMARLASLAALALAACGGGAASPSDGGADGGAPDAATVDPTDALFHPGHVLDVRITMAAADWDLLRHEQPPATHGTCAQPSVADGYAQYHADITVDGVTVTDVSVRKKGNLGSVSAVRPGLKIDAHQFVATQRISGAKHLTLNNNAQDATLISQCLGYELFAAAGLPASRCSFAHVTVNGEDLGIYSNVEPIKPDFLARHFADDTGRLYESGGDFAPGATGGFQPKTDPATPDCSDLDRVVTALGAPDDQLEAQLGGALDLDEVVRYWAMEVLLDHWDGYANNQNNFYVYHDPSTDRMSFLPWGIDALFTGRQRTTRPDSVFACGSLAWRLYDAPATRARYLAQLRELLGTVWDEPAILAEIDRMQALLAPYVDAAQLATNLDRTRAFVEGRRGVLLGELDAGDPVWPYPQGAASCRIHIGTVTASFATTWGTLGQWGVGSGATSGAVSGVDVTSPTLYANAGLAGDGRATVQLFAPLPDGRYAIVLVLVTPADFTPGTRAIDLSHVASVMMFYDPATDTTSGGGLLLPGSVTLTSASQGAGAPIVGSVTGDVLEL